jgi:uncharacterized protein (TIGR02246 family)
VIHSKLLGCAGLVVALLADVRPASGQTTAGADTLPTVTLPAPLDRVLRDYERHWRASDAKGLASLFTNDGFVLSSGRPPVRGREAIQARYTGQGGPLHLRAVAFATDDTVGYIVGTYGGTQTEMNEGKFILLLRRQRAGQWMIAADMDNTNRPPRPRPQSTPE